MKKIYLTNLSITGLLFILLFIPWNINFAKSDCSGILNKNVCKNSLIIIQKKFIEKSCQRIDPGVFPYDDLLIKI